MKTLFLDCSMGCAGDMLMGALYDIAGDKREILKTLKLPGVTIEAVKEQKCDITGTHMVVKVHNIEENQDNGHHHHHHHSSYHNIEEIINTLEIPEKVKEDAKQIYSIIAQAESQVHGKEVTEVHFHEVGMLDAVADVVSCSLLIYELGIEKIIASPVRVGYGQVKCAHGILPVPAPATANILKGIPCYAGNIEGEMCTPTGAALLKYFVKEFRQMPVMTVDIVGYGMGSRDFEVANCIRAFIGEDEEQEEVIELKCNVDDMTGEELAYAMEVLLHSGAKDVYTVPIGMKKGRPGIMLIVTCDLKERDKFVKLIFKYTSTIGMKVCRYERVVLDRKQEVKNTAYGDVNIKRAFGYGIEKEKIEYEDLKMIAERTGKTIGEIRTELQ